MAKTTELLSDSNGRTTGGAERLPDGTWECRAYSDIGDDLRNMESAIVESQQLARKWLQEHTNGAKILACPAIPHHPERT